jgi:hypothetical protein
MMFVLFLLTTCHPAEFQNFTTPLRRNLKPAGIVRSLNRQEDFTTRSSTLEVIMQPFEVAIPIVFFCTIALIWGGVILTRHKERMTMIEKGLKAEDIKSLYQKGTLRTNPLSSLKWGIIFLAIGVAALVGMWLHQSYYVEESVIPGLMAVLGGLGLIAFYFIANRKQSE